VIEGSGRSSVADLLQDADATRLAAMPTRRTALVALAFLGACAPGNAYRQSRADLCTQDASEPPTVRDRDVKQRLEDALEELAQSGAAVEIDVLEEQLDRRTTDAWTAAEQAREALSGAGVRDRIHGSVAIVGKRYLCGKCDDWHLSTATGFFVSEDGVLVTNRHVVDGLPGTTFAAMTTDGEVHPVVEVLAAHADADVALLRVEGEGLPALPLRSGVRPGETVHVLSHPDSAFWYFSTGNVARRTIRKERRREPIEMLEITADYARGSSGGPVVDATGAVVGVVQATNSVYYDERGDAQENLQMVFKYVVPAEAVLELLR